MSYLRTIQAFPVKVREEDSLRNLGELSVEVELATRSYARESTNASRPDPERERGFEDAIRFAAKKLREAVRAHVGRWHSR